MGASSSSPRDLTIQEDVTGTGVKVSEAVARRLVGQSNPPEPAETLTITHSTVTDSDMKDEIQKIQSRYEKRISALEQQNKELHNVTTEEFSKAVNEVEEKFAKIAPEKPICTELQTKVMECYQYNSKKPLLCAPTVKEYKACVKEQRDEIMIKNDEDCQPCMLAQMARGPCGLHFMKAYDCYLEEGAEEKCGMLYLEMKACWDANPKYGYEKIVDKAYTPSKPDTSKPTSNNNERKQS